VPPEFVPSEGRRRRETAPPKEPRTVDDLVNEIMRKYREEQRRLGNVDNWGQPKEKLDRKRVEKWVEEQLKRLNDNEKRVRRQGERKFSPKAAAESMSEAIANKFRGRGNKDSEGLKRRESGESRKTVPSASEKKAAEAKSPSKRESRERLRPQVDKRNPESRKEELNPKNPQDDRKPLKSYKVNMYTPKIRDEEIETEKALKRFSNDELPGMKYLPNHNKLFSDAVAHMRLRELVGDRRELSLSEIRVLSEQTHLPFRTTRNHVTNAGRPEYYRLAEKAITKLEAKSIIDDTHSKIGTIQNYSDVEQKLRENGSLEHLRSLSSYRTDDAMVQKYFKFIDALSEGGLMRDIARRVGISEGTGISWTKGVLPLYIKRALKTSDSSTAQRHHELERFRREFTRDAHHVSRINTTRPEINGVPVESDKHLKDIITREYRGLMDMPGIEKLLHEGCVHQQIINRFQGREYLEYGEIRQLAAEFGVKRGVVQIWTTKGVIPRIYFHLNRSVSISEARKRIEEVSKRNNGVITFSEYERRMQNYYLHQREQKASFNERESAITETYFRFLEKYQQGGSFAPIARQAGVAPSTALGWLEGQQPRRVRIASGIPREEPVPDYKWLPMRFRSGKYPEDFIQVPEHVKSYRDVLIVLQQLTPIENEYLSELHARLGLRSIDEEFMYLLGSYMSDGSSFNRTTIARSIGIRLSKTYHWSEDFGDGLCQALGACGINAYRVGDTAAKTAYKKEGTEIREINQNEKMSWACENSPLLHWMYHSCLGYKDGTPKNRQQTSADWIIDAPLHLRKPFLQGLGDGDGSASVQGNYIDISSLYNQDFIEKLLQSFGVRTRRAPKDIVTTGMSEAKKAAQIPPFRYASSRLEAAERIINRIDNPRRVRENPLDREEIEFISAAKERGLTAWQTSEAFFDEFKTALSIQVIKRLFRINGKNT
jgi:hypothetical protein